MSCRAASDRTPAFTSSASSERYFLLEYLSLLAEDVKAARGISCWNYSSSPILLSILRFRVYRTHRPRIPDAPYDLPRDDRTSVQISPNRAQPRPPETARRRSANTPFPRE